MIACRLPVAFSRYSTWHALRMYTIPPYHHHHTSVGFFIRSRSECDSLVALGATFTFSAADKTVRRMSLSRVFAVPGTHSSPKACSLFTAPATAAAPATAIPAAAATAAIKATAAAAAAMQQCSSTKPRTEQINHLKN